MSSEFTFNPETNDITKWIEIGPVQFYSRIKSQDGDWDSCNTCKLCKELLFPAVPCQIKDELLMMESILNAQALFKVYLIDESVANKNYPMALPKLVGN